MKARIPQKTTQSTELRNYACKYGYVLSPPGIIKLNDTLFHPFQCPSQMLLSLLLQHGSHAIKYGPRLVCNLALVDVNVDAPSTLRQCINEQDLCLA